MMIIIMMMIIMMDTIDLEYPIQAGNEIHKSQPSWICCSSSLVVNWWMWYELEWVNMVQFRIALLVRIRIGECGAY